MAIFNLGTNSEAVDKIKNSPTSEVEEFKREFIENIKQNESYQKNISKLKVDTFIPERSAENQNGSKSIGKQLLVGFVVLLLVGSLVSKILRKIFAVWESFAHGKHIWYSDDLKFMLGYVKEFAYYYGIKMEETSYKISNDKKTVFFNVGKFSEGEHEFSLSDKINSCDLGAKNNNSEVNVIVFCGREQHIELTNINNNIKRLFIISSGSVKINKAQGLEFLYANCQNLSIPDESKNWESNLKEVILNIESLTVSKQVKEDNNSKDINNNKGNNNKDINNLDQIMDSAELKDRFKNNKCGLLGQNKNTNKNKEFEYKIKQGFLSDGGFGIRNWLTITTIENKKN